jgi:outer membrane receptor protein involved in Fe transport
MSHSSNIRQAVRYTLAAAAFASAYTVPATAQTELEEVVVTGSRIARADYDAASPVITLDQDTFKLSGEAQLETVLNSMPQLVPSITTTSNNPSNGGQANVDLRGLGTQRTLVLLDGSRLTPSNLTGVVDLNTIPSALIQNIEILTGGASSVYGSDAVAGVVNVRLKQDFEGVQINTQYGITDKSDGQSLLVEGLIGGNFAEDRGNAVLSLSYDTRDEVLAGDRGFGEVSLGAQLQPLGSGTVPDGRIDWGTVANPAGGPPISNAPSQAALNAVFGAYGAAPGSVPGSAAIGFNTDGTLFSFGRGTAAQPVVNFRGNTNDPGYNPLSYSYNFGPVNYLQLPLTRRQIAGFATYDIVPDVAEMYTRIMYTTYNSDQQLASTPVTCTGAALGCSIPLTNPLIPADLRALLAERPVPGAALPTSAFSRRFLESGPRVSNNDYDVTQGLVGFRGDFTNGWNWDVFGSWGKALYTNLQDGNLSRSRLQAAYNNPAVYASSGCAQFNPFGAGNVSPACAQAVTIRATNVQETEQTQVVGSVTGDIIDLPAGALQFNVGAEYRKNTGEFRPDQFLASGDVVGFNAQQPTSGEVSVTEGFVELAVPILKDMTGASFLGMDLGYRYSDYNLAGSHSTYKVALQWNPIDSLKVRGSYNRAIRAPSISELFLPRQENFPQYSDPCNSNSTFRTGPDAAAVAALCLAQGIPAGTLGTFQQANPQARTFVGGNTELEPETADTYTAGVAWQSAFDSVWAQRLSASVDYWNYEIEDVIGSFDVSSIIGRCFNQLDSNPTYDPNNSFCQLFTRSTANFAVQDISATNLNLGGLKREGVDMQLDYGLPLDAFGADPKWGDLSLNVLFTYLLNAERQETVTSPWFDRKGTISQTVASAFPEIKGRMMLSWNVSDFLFRYTLRYTDGMDVVNNDAIFSPSTGAVPTVDSFVYHDISARWNATDMISVTAGVTNLTDEEPPVYTTSTQAGIQSNTDPSTYDVLGLRYFVNVGVKF